MFKIALSAGHGMNTPGKRCMKSIDKNETREWYLNDRICDKVEKKLALYDGYSLLRVDDTTGKTDVPLENRVGNANKWGADFYLSIHHNAGINGGSGGGIISIAHTKASETSKKYQKIIYDELIKETGFKGNRSTPLAFQNLYECRVTNMPAVLVECGFMDSTTDVPIILSEAFAEKASTALVSALITIGNLKPKNKGELTMSQYEELKRELDALKEAIGTIYKTADEIPDYYKPTIQPMIDKGVIKGTGNNNLNLPEITVRTLVYVKRDDNCV